MTIMPTISHPCKSREQLKFSSPLVLGCCPPHVSASSVLPLHPSGDSRAITCTLRVLQKRMRPDRHLSQGGDYLKIKSNQNFRTSEYGRTGAKLCLQQTAGSTQRHRHCLPWSNSSSLGISKSTSKMGAIDSRRRSPRAKMVEILVNPDSSNKELLSKIPVLKESYKRPFWLSNCHLETIFAAYFRSLPKLQYKRECLRMGDGGTVSLDWPVNGDDKDIWNSLLDQDAPVLVVLPGLSGGSQDDYVRYLLIQARKVGWRGVVFNSRGCANSPVTTAQFYSASYTEDLRQVVKHVGSVYKNSRIYAAGWSLGANILVRYMGQDGENCPLAGGVSLCNPFNLVLADDNFHRGFNNIYDRSLAKSLGKIFARSAALFEDIGGDYDVSLAANAKTVRDFDQAITRVDEYYYESSSSRSIKDVRRPLLCIQAEDDPIAPSAAIPRRDIEANLNCALVITPAGGHLGWIAGPQAPFGAPWTDPLIMDYLKLLEASAHSKPAFEKTKGQAGDVQLVGVETREE